MILKFAADFYQYSLFAEGTLCGLLVVRIDLFQFLAACRHHHIHFRLPERPQKPIELATIKQQEENCKNEKIHKK